jgi:hypothetical protein
MREKRSRLVNGQKARTIVKTSCILLNFPRFSCFLTISVLLFSQGTAISGRGQTYPQIMSAPQLRTAEPPDENDVLASIPALTGSESSTASAAAAQATEQGSDYDPPKINIFIPVASVPPSIIKGIKELATYSARNNIVIETNDNTLRPAKGEKGGKSQTWWWNVV